MPLALFTGKVAAVIHNLFPGPGTVIVSQFMESSQEVAYPLTFGVVVTIQSKKFDRPIYVVHVEIVLNDGTAGATGELVVRWQPPHPHDHRQKVHA